MKLRIKNIPVFILALVLLLALSVSLTSCHYPSNRRPPVPVRIKMATTTSIENSGLLEVLLPPFEEEFRVKVDVIALGTGKALKLAENGDVDIVFVHAPQAEEEFIKKGFGINRRQVMSNYFIIIGPEDDPVGIKGLDTLTTFKKIYDKKYLFVSRGDESGTHKKEKQIWALAGLSPQGRWYLQTGQGMGATLRIADEKKAYCLTDRGTYITYKNDLNLIIVSQGQADELLFNPYSIIAVHPARHPHVQYSQAMAFIGWVTSLRAQNIIKEYKIGGEPLFYPLAEK